VLMNMHLWIFNWFLMKRPDKTAKINFLGSVYSEFDSFFCGYVLGDKDCKKCPSTVFCPNRGKVLR
jgi:hypothetical protein